MNEFEKKLTIYFHPEELESLKEELTLRQRGTVLNRDYFAKVGKNTETLFFDNLVKEITLYRNNPNHPYLPSYVDSIVTDTSCLLILKRIDGVPIGTTRNQFDLALSYEEREKIAQQVLQIKDLSVQMDLEDSYSRKEKLDRYFDRAKPYLSSELCDEITSYYFDIVQEPTQKVLAHGDLIPPNIFLQNGNVCFIDWEYIGLKPRYYDFTYFLLFSKENDCFHILNDTPFTVDQQEVYRDGIIICLKEIGNNAKLFGKVEDNLLQKNIQRWKKELTLTLQKYPTKNPN